MTQVERVFTPGRLAIGIAFTMVISIVSFTFTLWLVTTRAADAAAAKASRETSCGVWGFMAAVDPPPTTARGKDLQERAAYYYDLFDCEKVVVEP